jgi:hypothetical protein
MALLAAVSQSIVHANPSLFDALLIIAAVFAVASAVVAFLQGAVFDGLLAVAIALGFVAFLYLV